MKVEVRPVFQGGIDIVWPLIKEGLDKIDKKGMEDDPQELIRHLLKTTPYMMAYLIYAGKEYLGFIIGRIDVKVHHQEFCIYKAYKLNGSDYTLEVMDQIKGIAEANKCKLLTFYSVRKGWKKRAEQLGFKEGYTQYVQEV